METTTQDLRSKTPERKGKSVLKISGIFSILEHLTNTFPPGLLDVVLVTRLSEKWSGSLWVTNEPCFPSQPHWGRVWVQFRRVCVSNPLFKILGHIKSLGNRLMEIARLYLQIRFYFVVGLLRILCHPAPFLRLHYASWDREWKGISRAYIRLNGSN